MPSNKKRLYVALYPSGVVNNPERMYHWGFIIGPKEKGTSCTPSAGVRCHVKNRISDRYPSGEWIYESVPLANAQTSVRLLARILVAKIEDEARLIRIIEEAPVISGDPSWRCRTWVGDVLQRLKADGKAVGTSELGWARIEAFGRQYVEGKTASSRYGSQAQILGPKPTYDLLEDKELVP